VNPLAADLARALDPVALGSRTGFDPDPLQAQLMRSRDPRILVLCHRQWGKSTVAAHIGLHQALYEPGLVLLISRSQRQSGILFKKLLGNYRAHGRPLPAEAENALSLELENGSWIVSLPGTEANVRGYSGAKLIVIDEAARVDDELYFAVLPMLAVSGGRLLALSTPWAKSGWFYRAWANGEERWTRVTVTASTSGRIPPQELERQRAEMGEWRYAREFECVFADSEDALFRLEDIERALTDDVAPLFPGEPTLSGGISVPLHYPFPAEIEPLVGTGVDRSGIGLERDPLSGLPYPRGR
jgi:Terminase large subunit, T4likevirus-type, N-terminal